jgi:hypothetical protein
MDRTTTRLSSSIRMAIASRRIARRLLERAIELQADDLCG